MQDVIFQVKADLGPEAVIVNKRKFKQGGIFGFFAKEMFEIVAALEAENSVNSTPSEQAADDVVEISNYGRDSRKIERNNIQKTASEDPANKNAIKEFINDLKTESNTNATNFKSSSAAEKEKGENFREQFNQKQAVKTETKNNVLKKEPLKSEKKVNSAKSESKVEDEDEVKVQAQNNLTAAQKLQNKFQAKNIKNNNKTFKNSNQLYNYLLDHGVDSRNVNLFLKGMKRKLEDIQAEFDFETNLKKFLESYFAENKEIEVGDSQKIVSFIGPTGVGKTTTMAKIAASFALDKDKNVGLITADTYRIAAVEQLKTYSEIIDIPFAVCYSSSKLQSLITSQFNHCDLILIDTPGSSWRDKEQLKRLNGYVNHDFIDEVHLLLSLNTKSRDLRNIISKFSALNPDRALLTKIDETSSYGDILNIKENYNLPLSYLTCGQDVPEDLEIADFETIYKYLFGDFYA